VQTSVKLFKNIQMQGVRVLRSEAYFDVRCNDEGRSTTQQMGVFQQLTFAGR
jgi:hypothetical protein